SSTTREEEPALRLAEPAAAGTRQRDPVRTTLRIRDQHQLAGAQTHTQWTERHIDHAAAPADQHSRTTAHDDEVARGIYVLDLQTGSAGVVERDDLTPARATKDGIAIADRRRRQLHDGTRRQ